MATFENPYGLYFPIALSDGAPVPPALEDSIDSSLRIILSWAFGLRFFLFSFGSILERLVSSPNGSKALVIIEQFVIQAIARWEPRIQIQEVNIIRTKEGDGIEINLSALVIKTQNIYNYTTLI